MKQQHTTAAYNSSMQQQHDTACRDALVSLHAAMRGEWGRGARQPAPTSHLPVPITIQGSAQRQTVLLTQQGVHVSVIHVQLLSKELAQGAQESICQGDTASGGMRWAEPVEPTFVRNGPGLQTCRGRTEVHTLRIEVHVPHEASQVILQQPVRPPVGGSLNGSLTPPCQRLKVRDQLLLHVPHRGANQASYLPNRLRVVYETLKGGRGHRRHPA